MNEQWGGKVRPDIVMYGEPIDPDIVRQIEEDCKKCDCLIVMGTSLRVGPVNQILALVPDDCPRLLVNREPAGLEKRRVREAEVEGGFQPGDGDPYAMHFGFRFGEDLRVKNNPKARGTVYRDVFLRGSCDEGVGKLREGLGWGS